MKLLRSVNNFVYNSIFHKKKKKAKLKNQSTYRHTARQTFSAETGTLKKKIKENASNERNNRAAFGKTYSPLTKYGL